MKLILIDLTRQKKITQKKLQTALNLILAQLSLVKLNKSRKKQLKANALTLQFVGAKTQEQLNFQYRKRRKVTDILSFSPIEAASLGELSLCPEKIEKDARLNILPYEEHLLYLMIHGVLHLLGYDHEINDKAAQQMYDLQDQIFAELRVKWP